MVDSGCTHTLVLLNQACGAFWGDTMLFQAKRKKKEDGQMVCPDTAQWYPHFVMNRHRLYKAVTITLKHPVVDAKKLLGINLPDGSL